MEYFQSLKLNKKHQDLYMYLLENGPQTATELANKLMEQRTNIYLISEVLITKGLVERDESKAVTRFKVTNPSRLQELISFQQKNIAQKSLEIRQALPDLIGKYHLHTAKEGFAYFEGVDGYKSALEDMHRSSSEICIFSTEAVDDRPDLWEILQSAVQRRAIAKISSRMLLPPNLRDKVDFEEMARKRMNLKFWGNDDMRAEIAIYDQTSVFTTYDEKLVSVVIKNSAITSTLRAIFDTAWKSIK